MMDAAGRTLLEDRVAGTRTVVDLQAVRSGLLLIQLTRPDGTLLGTQRVVLAPLP